jgi:hypothetical protein
MRTSLAAQMTANPAFSGDLVKPAVRLVNEDEGTYGKTRLTVSAITHDARSWSCRLSHDDLGHMIPVAVTQPGDPA